MPKRTTQSNVIRESTEPTKFLNVDVDVYSSADLTPLAIAMEADISVLFVGKVGRRHELHFEISESTRRLKVTKSPFRSNPCDGNVDRIIQKIVSLIETLPPPARRLWDGAKARQFNVGIQAGRQPHCIEYPIQPETLRRVAKLKANIVTTIYASEKA